MRYYKVSFLRHYVSVNASSKEDAKIVAGKYNNWLTQEYVNNYNRQHHTNKRITVKEQKDWRLNNSIYD